MPLLSAVYFAVSYKYIYMYVTVNTQSSCFFVFFCCRYLSDEDDGVSEPIITFAVQYVGIMKVSK